MQKLQVNVEQVGLAVFAGDDDVGVPDLFGEGARTSVRGVCVLFASHSFSCCDALLRCGARWSRGGFGFLKRKVGSGLCTRNYRQSSIFLRRVA